MAAQAHQESGYNVWAYPLSSTASGISQFVVEALYDVVINSRAGINQYVPILITPPEIALITKNINGDLTDINTYKVKTQLGRENRPTLHQNVIDNPEIMIKAQYRYMKYIHDYKKFNEGINWSKFNPIKMLNSGIESIKSFLIWNKESKDPMFYKVRNIVDFIIENLETFNKVLEKSDIIKGKIAKLKEEENKDYSELKYKLIDDIKILWVEYELTHSNSTEEFILKYYKETGSELYGDIVDAISFLKKSKWFINTHHMESLSIVKNILDNSHFQKTLNSVKNVI
jgi:hypothetical protein